MTQAPSAAANMPPPTQQRLVVEMLSKTESISRMADQQGLSRKFLYQKKVNATETLEKAYALPSQESEVLFYPPVTHSLLY